MLFNTLSVGNYAARTLELQWSAILSPTCRQLLLDKQHQHVFAISVTILASSITH